MSGLEDAVAALAEDLGVTVGDLHRAARLAALSFVHEDVEVEGRDGPVRVPDGTWAELVRFAARTSAAAPRDGDPADRLAAYVTRALAAMTADPEARHETADLLSAEEHRQQREWSGAARELPDHRFAELFAVQAGRTPDRPAVVHRGETWSYATLDRAANAVAHRLLAEGVDAEDVVAVTTDRSLWWAAAVVGVLRAGAAYLPVEKNLPAHRVSVLLRESRCRVALTDECRPPTDGVRFLPVPALVDSPLGTDESGVAVRADQLAYVYFTSGSTGTPKGAMCEHAGLVNHLLAKIEDLRLTAEDVVVQSAPVSFDISLWQLIAPLVVGACSVIVPHEVIVDPRRFVDTVEAASATVLQVVPSYLDVLLRQLEADGRRLGRVRVVSVTGEALPPHLVTRWFACHPAIPLVNAYGATEACDDATHAIITAPLAGNVVPVGRPLPNVTVHVLGRGDRLLPVGAVGEIAFSGVCVGRGYLNDPDRTAEVFGTDPYRPGARLYRTGDLGRWLPTGELVFVGREDDQVKIRGMRVELGEVESRMLAHPAVSDASVIVLRPAGVLVGFYRADQPVDREELANFLAVELPAGSRPAQLHPVAAIPRTANGKTDRRALTDLVRRVAVPPPAAGRSAEAVRHRIAHAWASVLGRPPTELTDGSDFFDLGGDSLSAIRVVAVLEGLVALDDFLRTPVLGRLVELTSGRPPDVDLVRRLDPGGPDARLALLCLPYPAGTTADFHLLADAVAARDPRIAVYGVQPPGHDLSRPGELVELTDLAERLAVWAKRPEVAATPLALWGQASGAALAFEAARLLEAGGLDLRNVLVGGWDAEEDVPAAIHARRRLDGLTADQLATVRSVYRHDVAAAARYLRGSGPTWQACRLRAPVTVVTSTSGPGAGGGLPWHAARVTSVAIDDLGPFVNGAAVAAAAELIVRIGQT